MTRRDRPKLPLLVLAAGGVLLGAAALQSLLIRVPGPAANNPHAITVDTKPSAASPKPWDEPAPIVEVAPAEPFDAAPTGAVPDAPKSADHAIDPEGPPSPRDAANTPSDPALAKPEGAGAEPPKAPDKPAAIEPKVETPPADMKPAPKPEPTQVAAPSPESAPTRASPETLPAESKPIPAPEPAKVEFEFRRLDFKLALPESEKGVYGLRLVVEMGDKGEGRGLLELDPTRRPMTNWARRSSAGASTRSSSTWRSSS